MTFCSKNPVEYQTLALVQKPEETETYFPVGHDHLALRVKEIGTAYLGNHVKSKYGLSKDGQQMFGMSTFKVQGLGNRVQHIALGYHNSYDKSLTVGIVGGSNVLVCDNLCLWGEMKEIRKHTKGVLPDVDVIITAIASTLAAPFEKFLEFAESLRGIELSNDEAWGFLGIARGRKILRPVQHAKSLQEWDTPSYPEWQSRDAWSLVNACTEGLKSSNPYEVAERFRKIHDMSKEWWCPETKQEAADRLPEREVAGEVSDRFSLLEID